jgi:hypothetical protein
MIVYSIVCSAPGKDPLIYKTFLSFEEAQSTVESLTYECSSVMKYMSKLLFDETESDLMFNNFKNNKSVSDELMRSNLDKYLEARKTDRSKKEELIASIEDENIRNIISDYFHHGKDPASIIGNQAVAMMYDNPRYSLRIIASELIYPNMVLE